MKFNSIFFFILLSSLILLLVSCPLISHYEIIFYVLTDATFSFDFLLPQQLCANIFFLFWNIKNVYFFWVDYKKKVLLLLTLMHGVVHKWCPKNAPPLVTKFLCKNFTFVWGCHTGSNPYQKKLDVVICERLPCKMDVNKK